MSSEGWHVSAKDINHWVETNGRQAQGDLPLLIQKLILASVKPSELYMPVGDGVLNKGWDGKINVEAGEGNAFVPSGYSVWELSTQKDVERKIEDDFNKRTNNSLVIEKETSTFVLVTCRDNIDLEKWLSSKRNDGIWPHKTVRVIIEALDNDNIEKGIEIEHHKQRGATMRHVGDGGTQERAIADSLLNDASKLRISSPRTALLLRKIAESYESVGTINDNQDKLIS